MGERQTFLVVKAILEKDWGRSFPSAYIWIQCNVFPTENVSFFLHWPIYLY
ncbi:tocopherol cyclase family protein [endosymbiont 'TC1' of Trimyema compressum]|uniref:tocopherol cyclase family protein n=1 Tax=endosymbiont 'TC1' of Trimyema compressum TaxID=243899 RepID=UPI00316ACD72